MGLSIKLDAHELIARMDFAERQLHDALRSAVTKAARTSRREALNTFAQDANIPGPRARRGQPLVRNYGDLSATWSPSKSAANMASTGGVAATRRGGLTGSTFALTGGNSASLHAPHAFILRANGGRFVLNRVGFGPGTHRRNGVRKMYAENANAGLFQSDGAPRLKWQKVADEITPTAITDAVQTVLDGYAPGSDSGGE